MKGTGNCGGGVVKRDHGVWADEEERGGGGERGGSG